MVHVPDSAVIGYQLRIGIDPRMRAKSVWCPRCISRKGAGLDRFPPSSRLWRSQGCIPAAKQSWWWEQQKGTCRRGRKPCWGCGLLSGVFPALLAERSGFFVFVMQVLSQPGLRNGKVQSPWDAGMRRVRALGRPEGRCDDCSGEWVGW